VRIATCPTADASGRVREALQAAGIAALSTAVNEGVEERHAVFVPVAFAARARRVIQTAMLEP
jgi:hypothetical protein